MDVSEFLRINAQESSLQRLKQISRSSGDGQDSPLAFGSNLVSGTSHVDMVPSTRFPYSESPRPIPPTVTLSAPAAKLISLPPGRDLIAKKNLMPYMIDVTPKVLSSTSKRAKVRAKQSVCNHSVNNVAVINELTQTKLGTEEVKATKYQCSNNFDTKFTTVHKGVSQEEENTNQESLECSPFMNKVNTLVKTLPKEAVIAPLNLDLLNSPPSEIVDKVKVFMSPKPPGVPTSKHSSIKYTKLTRKTFKEPKFVPYEPYKGCSEPIFGGKDDKKISIKKEFAVTSQPDLPAIPLQEPAVHQDTDRKARAKLEMAVKDFETERALWEQRLKDMTTRCEQAEHQLSKSQRQTTALEDQLNVQAHVNGELKKLLVASVGEDVQGRVHCLTEDKARMATMIRKYSDKLDRDYEERERMAILCDVWKSKFLASSVLVEELGSWKAALLRWTAEAAESLSVLLEEHSLIRTHTTRAHRLVAQLVTAFDPLQSGSGVSPSLLQHTADGVSVSLAVAEQAQALHQRLLGPLQLHPPAPPVPAQGDDQLYTPGEKMALQVLDRRDSCVGYPGYAGSAQGPRVPAGHPLHTTSNTLPSHMTVNCCAHCNGDIQLV